MKPTLDWLEKPEVFGVNRIPAHSDHLIYNDAGLMRQSLNGTWKFSYAKNPEQRVKEFYRCDFYEKGFDEIQVPGHIQLQGYGQCQYVNMMYPWDGKETVVAPGIPKKENPVGSYVTYFEVEDRLKDTELYLSLQGVEAACYVWINGEFVGYSEDSFTPAEFLISPYVKEGKNKLAIEVYRFCSGSWLEDQDFWRFSGIFRDVFLYGVPKLHIQDMKILAEYDDKDGSGSFFC